MCFMSATAAWAGTPSCRWMPRYLAQQSASPPVLRSQDAPNSPSSEETRASVSCLRPAGSQCPCVRTASVDQHSPEWETVVPGLSNRGEDNKADLEVDKKENQIYKGSGRQSNSHRVQGFALCAYWLVLGLGMGLRTMGIMKGEKKEILM